MYGVIFLTGLLVWLAYDPSVEAPSALVVLPKYAVAIRSGCGVVDSTVLCTTIGCYDDVRILSVGAPLPETLFSQPEVPYVTVVYGQPPYTPLNITTRVAVQCVLLNARPPL
jgi:hypothetical protein